MAVDTKTLIATIVSEVLHRLEQPAGPVALVLAPACDGLKREVQNRLGGNAQVYFQGNEPSVQPDLYVLPELSCSDLADLAVGRGGSIAMRTVLELLLQGKDVRTLGFAWRAHAQTAPYALRRLYEGHVATLATYGLTELAAQTPESVSVPHTPVTAEHVTMAAAKGARTLRVPHCAVVTPLAQEAAANHNMTILKNL